MSIKNEITNSRYKPILSYGITYDSRYSNTVNEEY